MKTRIIAPIALLGLISAFLLPTKTSRISALPENLRTSKGYWKHPSGKNEIQSWVRTEYGFVWPWLVVDRGTSEAAWYARIDPKYLALYSALALGLTLFVSAKCASWARK